MINMHQAGVAGVSAIAASAGGQRQFSALDKLRGVVVFVAFASVLSLSAGRWDLPFFWAYWLMFCTFAVVTLRLVHRKHPDLLQERFRPGPGARDPKSRPVLVMLVVSHWVLAGLDVGRYHWSDGIPLAAQIAALVAFGLGLVGWAWSMLSNRFFSSEVRIQTDRGHQLESGGPYRFVRHPGYFSALLVFAASPLVLGSLWSILPIVAVGWMFLRRTALEDRMLQAELPGYAEYAARVRFRLFPGVW
jgi:protein-S-isoprenylcysteine O-methyltransferase Ste14